MRRHVMPVAAAAAVTTLLTFLYCRPLFSHVGSALPHDAGDPLLVTWLLWWSTKAIPLTTPWWNAPAFHPSLGVFAFSEALLGLQPLTAPITAMSGSPVAAYNAAFVVSCAASVATGYVLGWVVTRRHGPAMIAGVAFGFSVYRAGHLHHLQMLSSYWMPLAIAALHLYDRLPSWRRAGLFAGSWLLQALCCGYYFFYLSILALLWLAWFGVRRWRLAEWRRLAISWAVAVALIAPLLAGYHRVQAQYGFSRSRAEILNYSADLAGVFEAPREAWLWGSILPGDEKTPESNLFPGLTVAALTLAALLAWLRTQTTDEAATAERRNLGFYLAGAGACWLLALGPLPAWHGHRLGVPGPYAMLTWLPGFNGVRVPARFWMLSVMCLSVAAALVVARIRSARLQPAVVLLAVAGLFLEGWPVLILARVPPPRPAVTAARIRLGLPLEATETETMVDGLRFGQRVVNGYSGYTAPQHFALRDLLARSDAAILDRLAGDEDLEVVIDRRLDTDGRLRKMLDTSPEAARKHDSAEWTSYLVARTGHGAPPPPRGTDQKIAGVSASVNDHDVAAVLDRDLLTRWNAPQAVEVHVVVDLGESVRPSWVVLSLGPYPSQYPDDLIVELSSDAATWRAAPPVNVPLAAYDGALRDPRAAPIALPLPAEPARYIRLRPAATRPHRHWSLVELQVLR